VLTRLEIIHLSENYAGTRVKNWFIISLYQFHIANVVIFLCIAKFHSWMDKFSCTKPGQIYLSAAFTGNVIPVQAISMQIILQLLFNYGDEIMYKWVVSLFVNALVTAIGVCTNRRLLPMPENKELLKAESSGLFYSSTHTRVFPSWLTSVNKKLLTNVHICSLWGVTPYRLEEIYLY
jgi:hypothetical protein